MQWLNEIVDELIKRHPDGEITVSSGVSPSGAYHVGTLREVLTAEVIVRELGRRDRAAKHIHVSDNLDVFRKVPVGLPESYAQYLGKPLCDIPAPDGSQQSYADYYVNDLPVLAERLKLGMEIVRAHERYRSGFFVSAIETTLQNSNHIKKILTDVSGRELDDAWSPVQVLEDGYLKNRRFISIDTTNQTIVCEDKDGGEQTVSYASGDVKLNWRIDWPARWALLHVNAEPFGRDHSTKGGSYDTGAAIVQDVFKAPAPYPVPYHFVNRTGETKKMSKSGGDTITAVQLLELMPPEIAWYFMLKSAPEKQLFFDTGPTFISLIDEFSELLAKPDKTPAEQQLVDLCMYGSTDRTISNIPFPHLVSSYQASLRDVEKTIEIIKRTEHAARANDDAEIIKNELGFIDHWLDTWAPEEVKFSLRDNVEPADFSDEEKKYFNDLADKISNAPDNADGEWFHKAVYGFKESHGLSPQVLFGSLYKLLIDKNAGPRAGWFLSILPRDWLLSRLRLQG